MSSFRKRFLVVGVVVITIIILGAVVSHIRVSRKSDFEIASKEPLKVLSREIKSLPSEGTFRISRVLDGDTIVLDNGETVRLIGVDAPEIHHPEIPVQRFAKESKEFLKQLAEGKECILEYEPDNIRDKYERLLAYVYVGDCLINAEMIRRGYAYAYTKFPFHRFDEFLTLEHEARGHQYGLWSISLRDGRIANLINRYESLNIEGRKKLDKVLEELAQKYPANLPLSEEKNNQPSTAASMTSKGERYVISWQDADKYYGKYATVEGTIVGTYNSEKVCFLNFHPDYKNHFTAVIFASAFPYFPENPETYYEGKKVYVSGYIKKYKGKPEIILNDSSQIEVFE